MYNTKPLAPMEPKLTTTIPSGDEWIAEVKWDGVRVLLFDDGSIVNLYNRKGRERTNHYPEIVNTTSYSAAKSIILDGEVIALSSDGKPDFHQVMRRDGIRKMERVALVQPVVPVLYMVFDVLFHDGAWCTDEPWQSRHERLQYILQPHPHVHLVTANENGQAVYDAVVHQGMEGIVLKNIHSPYRIGGKTNEWLKYKNYLDFIGVIGGFTLDGPVANALLIGLYKDGEFQFVGHVGTGRLTKNEWLQLTRHLKRLEQTACPFVQRPVRSSAVHWVAPQITIKIQYMEWQRHQLVRQPCIVGLPQVPPSSCVLSEDMQRCLDETL